MRESISIHAPPRGATHWKPFLWQSTRYFNSRPSARGDEITESVSVALSHFNSRPSARGDVIPSCFATSACISIHAPPRGATFLQPLRDGKPNEFQFTPLREGRPQHSSFWGSTLLFQFTPLREGRPSPRWREKPRWKFQFTPLREGRPPPRACHAARHTISIHAPPRGATLPLGVSG